MTLFVLLDLLYKSGLRLFFTIPSFWTSFLRSKVQCMKHACASLYLYQHCATKTQNEAVVEGMGGTWDRSATPARHPAMNSSVEEAVVSWNAPPAFLEAAVPFLRVSLTFISSIWFYGGCGKSLPTPR